MKFHKLIYFREEDKAGLEAIAEKHRETRLVWSEHAKHRLVEKVKDLGYFKAFFDAVYFKRSKVFEYELINGIIKKVVYRLDYDCINDLCISINRQGIIVTLWLNRKDDNHRTLNHSEYEKKFSHVS